jgi:hypothetical protein
MVWAVLVLGVSGFGLFISAKALRASSPSEAMLSRRWVTRELYEDGKERRGGDFFPTGGLDLMLLWPLELGLIVVVAFLEAFGAFLALIIVTVIVTARRGKQDPPL